MGRTFYNLTFPGDLKHDAILTFINNLGGLPNSDRDRAGSSMVFEIWSTKSGIRHRIGLPPEHPHLLDQLRTAIPAVGIERSEEPPTTGFSFLGEFSMDSEITAFNIKDPAGIATTILTSLQPIQDPGEAAVIQLVVAPTDRKAPKERKRLKPVVGSGGGGIWGMSTSIVNAFSGALDEKLEERNQNKLDLAKDKWEGYMFAVMVRVGIRAKSNESLSRLVNSTRNALQAAAGPHVSFEAESERKDYDAVLERLLAGTPPSPKWRCLFNAHELSCLIAFPIDSPAVPGLRLGGSFQAPPDNDIPRDGLVLAYSTYDDNKRPLAVPWSETVRHFYTAGKSGSGKTTLLENCAAQIMKHGSGLVYLDPIGDSATKLLDLVPAERLEDVIYFDPTDREAVVGINLFEGSTEHPDLTTDNIMGMLKSFYKDSWGDRLAYHLLGAIRTIATLPDSTLLDVTAMLTNDRFRDQVLERYKFSMAIRDYWEEFRGMKEYMRQEAVMPIMNKLQPFSMRDDLRHVIAQVHPALKMDDVLTKNKIVIANLNKGALGDDNSSLLGSMLMLKLWQAVQRRPEADRKNPFHCIVDECPDFMNLPTKLSSVLSQGRHYGFGLFLANQYPHQLDDEMRRAILGNVSSFAYFNLPAEDANIVAPQYGKDLKPEYLTTTGKREAVISISTGGEGRTRPTMGRSYPPSEPTGSTAKVLANKARYARPRAEVEAAIEQRREELVKRPIIGSREVTETQ